MINIAYFHIFNLFFFLLILKINSIKLNFSLKEKRLFLKEEKYEIDGIINFQHLIIEGGVQLIFKHEFSRIIIQNGILNITKNNSRKTTLRAEKLVDFIHVDSNINEFYGKCNFFY